jgi:NADP-dependent 3-hydroxy acid dehydrogenase YdfG
MQLILEPMMDLQLSSGVRCYRQQFGRWRSNCAPLAAEGVVVVVHGRDLTRTQAVANDIIKQGGTAHAVTADLTDDAAAQSCASSSRTRSAASISGKQWAGGQGGSAMAGWGRRRPGSCPQANVLATARMIDTFTPGMIQRGWGRVIQIASAVAVHQPPNFPDYQAARPPRSI